MYSKAKTCSLIGLSSNIIEVEGDLSNGLPAFNIVGLADVSIKESKERVRSAIRNNGYNFPLSRITINLSPANIKKEGSQLDLSIAVSILAANKIIYKKINEKTAFLGELSLDGRIIKVNGVLPMLIFLEEQGFEDVIIPIQNEKEGSVLKKIKVHVANTLKDVVDFLNEEKKLDVVEHYNDDSDIFNDNFDLDFSEINGQIELKRALEISAAGNHNILMVGPPGSGKTMIAKRFSSILPKLTFEEKLESTKIYSICGELKDGNLINRRPFRNPHTTSSTAALIGGGKIPMPGEISLAHNGVLFLDEFPEFQKNVIESLRQPLEDKIVTISRANSKMSFPSNFLLMASMNPCKCGYYKDINNKCTCSIPEIKRYIGKISNPILDRIDMHIEVKPIKLEEMQVEQTSEKSKTIRKRVQDARNIQINRYEKNNILYNSQLSNKLIKNFVKLNKEQNNILNLAFSTYKFSARSIDKLLKITRTIADLEKSEEIKNNHLLEAIKYRTTLLKYFRF